MGVAPLPRRARRVTAASWLAGVTKGAADSTLVAKYNDLESVKALFEANKDEISGVILEGVVGNSGFIVPDKEFLTQLRQASERHSNALRMPCE